MPPKKNKADEPKVEEQILDLNYFQKLNSIKCNTEKKNGLTYISWADGWAELKKVEPTAQYLIHENADGMPYFESKFGIFCKVTVTVKDLAHTVWLPVMDNNNMAQHFESYNYKTKYGDKTCAGADAFDINKTIQRAFAKAMGMHGLGIYVYRGEDLPESVEEPKKQESPAKPPVKETKMFLPNADKPSMAHTPPPEHDFPKESPAKKKELHMCNKCRHNVLVDIKEGPHGPYFKCPDCEKNSPAWLVKDPTAQPTNR